MRAPRQEVGALTTSSRNPPFPLTSWWERGLGEESGGLGDTTRGSRTRQRTWQGCQGEGGSLRDPRIYTSALPHPRSL